MAFLFLAFPDIVTERLFLRQLRLDDAEEIFELRTNEIVNKHLDRAKATSIEDAKEFIEKITYNVNAGQSLFWAICFKDQPKLVGTICLWNFSEEENKAETGYELLPEFHGKGIMNEAFSKVIEFGFLTLKLESIEAWTTLQNDGSIKVLERNCFQRNHGLESKINRAVEGPDLIIYSLSKKMFTRQVAVY